MFFQHLSFKKVISRRHHCQLPIATTIWLFWVQCVKY